MVTEETKQPTPKECRYRREGETTGKQCAEWALPHQESRGDRDRNGEVQNEQWPDDVDSVKVKVPQVEVFCAHREHPNGEKGPGPAAAGLGPGRPPARRTANTGAPSAGVTGLSHRPRI
jgi:hypothetical protein